MPMRLYDTARRAIVPFEPNEHVLMYTCGITPYDATHLGHAATFISYDVLQRRLIDAGHTVKCVRNVTDVDDPLFAKARELGVHYLDLAAGEEARFERDMVALERAPGRVGTRVRRRRSPTSAASSAWCSIAASPTRRAAAVYFDVSKFEAFGSLSNYTEAEMIELARQRGGHVDDPQQAPSARLRAVAPVGGRRAVVGHDVGPGSPGLAHRVQRARRCASSARRSISTAAGPT